MFPNEKIDSLLFSFKSLETREFIGSVEVRMDELIKHGLKNGSLY